ncbi:fluoride efflux transporter FluC [Bifidobacterium pullorum]|uniref:fluoride efflux transporter FluC n=1 Tax=Bifidobacterium pullorum TaxID=78448 RepID=UPI001EF646F8|nr:CrcB family protein [Bifidobacterium pullorum]
MSEERQLGAASGGDAAAVPTPAPDQVPPQIPLAPLKAVQPRFNPLADVMIYVVVFVGGCVGTGMRYGLSQLIPAAESGAIAASFHLATFVANMAACFVYAALTTYVSQASWIRKRIRQLTSRGVGMGMCGGFSTLSAMVIEELTSLRQGYVIGFAIYMLVSFAGGLAVAWYGTRLGLAACAKRQAKLVAAAFSLQPGGRHAMPAAMVTAVENAPIVVDAPVVVPVPDAAGAAAGKAADAADEDESIPSVSSSVIEPKPDTAEIPMVSDPFTGEVRG